MKKVVRLIVSVFIWTAVCRAQLEPCKLGTLEAVGKIDGVTLGRTALSEPSGEVGASVFIPEREEPVPGIIFSHSAIQGQTRRADLTRFGLALARAGAASIVLDGTIEWQTPTDNFKKPAPRTLACAGQWLLANVKLDRKRLAIAGTLNGWGSGNTPMCVFEAKWHKPCWSNKTLLNFGQTSPAEWGNTNGMLTVRGQLFMARFAQGQLGLSEVKREWLVEAASQQTGRSGPR